MTDVAVDLPTGAATVTANRSIDVAEVRAAVEGTGYQLVGLIGTT